MGPVHCGFSLLLVCMMTGTVFCNICLTSDELMDRRCPSNNPFSKQTPRKQTASGVFLPVFAGMG